MPISSGETTATFTLTSSIQPPPLVVTIGGVTTTVVFPPTSTPSWDPASSTVVYTLPTTVYTSGGTTQTFSEDQITTLSDYTETTTITTTWTEVSSCGTQTTPSTTVIPIIVTPGGFYWSPVRKPEPTFPGIVISNLPSIPPIPDPPWF
jgi:hypothetical protein